MNNHPGHSPHLSSIASRHQTITVFYHSGLLALLLPTLLGISIPTSAQPPGGSPAPSISKSAGPLADTTPPASNKANNRQTSPLTRFLVGHQRDLIVLLIVAASILAAFACLWTIHFIRASRTRNSYSNPTRRRRRGIRGSRPEYAYVEDGVESTFGQDTANQEEAPQLLSLNRSIREAFSRLSTQESAQADNKRRIDDLVGRLELHEFQLKTLQEDVARSLASIANQPIGHTASANPTVINPASLTSWESKLIPAAEQRSPLDPADAIAEQYQAAFFRGDRSELRRLTADQLNITDGSEGALMKPSSPPTQLEIVKTGGSYLLIHRDGRHWLVPEFQVLSSFSTNQIAKGIFSYARENISSAELRRPAEVQDVGGLWEVISMGIVAVPI